MLKKRVFSFVLALILISVLVFSSVFQASAADVLFYFSPYTTNYNGNELDTGVSGYPYKSLYDMIANYHDIMPTTYYFELQNTVQGGNSYAPSLSGNWYVPYKFDQSDFGVGDPIYKFYLPYNPNSSSNSWDFQIRTVLGNVVFDSQGNQMTQDPNNPYRGYYTLSFSESLNLGINVGWYFYSYYQAPPMPSIDAFPVYNITINYTYNGSIVDTTNILRGQTYEGFSLIIPSIPDYIIDSGYETHYFSSLLSDTTLTIPVKTVQDVINSAVDRYRPAYIYIDYVLYPGGTGERVVHTNRLTVIKNEAVDIQAPFLPGYLPYNFGQSDEASWRIYYPSGISSDITVRVNVEEESRVLDVSQAQINAGIAAYLNSDEYKANLQSQLDGQYNLGYNNGYAEGSGSFLQNFNPVLWSTGPVAAFLNLEIFPDLTLGILFVAAVAVSLVVIFLKIFSGGH